MNHLVYVCADPGVPVFGTKGCSIHVQEVIRAVRARGVRVTLVAARLGGPAPADLADLTVRTLPLDASDSPGSRELACLSGNARLREILSDCEPLDAVYERYSLWSHAAMEWAAARDLPGLLEVNAPLVEEQSAHRRLIHFDTALDAARRAFGHASALLAVSREVADYLARQSVPGDRVHLVPNGVDPDRFARPDPAATETRPFTLGFVGTLKPWHGVETLLEGFARALPPGRDWRLRIIGDGPQRSRIEDDARRLGIAPLVEFTGAVEPTRIPGLLSRIDLAAAPYPRLDHFYFSPLKIYEYMAAGLPIVASRLGQIDAVLDHQRTAWLVEPGDPEALSRALALLERRPDLRRRLGIAAREQVRRHHTWDGVASRILELARARPRPAKSGIPPAALIVDSAPPSRRHSCLTASV